MATWKPVKLLNGPASQGRQHAYQLDKIDAPFLKRRNGDARDLGRREIHPDAR